MEFDVLINSCLLDICANTAVTPKGNEHILSIYNDFEDGSWRYDKLRNFIWDNIAETALSIRERNCLYERSHSQLVASARNLRLTDSVNDIGKGSEIAEIILYGIMRRHYNALPVVPKIFYKQNVNDNAKGSDSVHIVIEGDDDFSIWFGEAKFYNSIEDSRLDSIIDSVQNSLRTDKLKKETSIITSLSDIDELISNATLRDKIKNMLSNQESIDNLKPKLHIPILILHECSITLSANELNDDYLEKLRNFHEDRAMTYFSKQSSKLESLHRYSMVTFHIILFPVPSKQEIINTFCADANHYKR